MRTVVLFSDIRGIGGPDDIGFAPLSLMTIASYLRANGVAAEIVDGQMEDDWRERLRRMLPDALFFGISAFTGPSLKPALEAAALARQAFPRVPIVWEAITPPKPIAHCSTKDSPTMWSSVPASRARWRSPNDCRRRRLSRSAHGRSGRRMSLSSMRGDVVLRRGAAIADPSQLPPVDYSCVDMEAYFAVNGRTLPYVSSYGCPHACAFCAEPAQSLRKWRARTASQVAADVQTLWSRFEPHFINICDPNFSSSPRRVAAIVDAFIDAGLSSNKLCDMRATDVLRLERTMDLRRLREAGFRTIYLGGESGSDAQLLKLAKGVRAADVLEACRRLDAAGVATIVSFMHDLPEETEDDSRRTFELVDDLLALPGNVQRHHFYTPFPATDMYRSPAVAAALGGRDIRQHEWASSSTYWASSFWRGRSAFRAHCRERLEAIRARLSDPQRVTLPTL